MPPDDDRFAALEQQVAALAAEVARLRGADGTDRGRAPAPAHHDALARASAVASAIGEDQIESIVGRYGTLLLGAFVLLMGVGVLIQFAVVHGLLTPAVRVGLGALVAAGVGAAGVYFHRRGDVRYGNVLLALALALVDLVAWGAGPRLHLVPTIVSLAVVDAVAIALGALALHDESEFLFSVAVGGALSAPFVTTEGIASPNALLAYGGVVLVGSLRVMRDARWERAFAMLVGAALVYALAAVSTPSGTVWSSAFAVSAFGGACALGALLLGQQEWRGSLARAFLAVALVGIPAAWDRVPEDQPEVTWTVALGLAGVTYAALFVRGRAALWTASALTLPFASLGIASAWTSSRLEQGGVFALWAAFALAAWRGERARDEPGRGGAHLVAGALLGGAGVSWLLWPNPLPLVAALSTWGVLIAWACRGETRPLPLFGVAIPLGAAALAALDQLASRQAYVYTPFTTRSSASALLVMLGLAGAAAALGGDTSAPGRMASRGVRLVAFVGFGILWGRMELAGAWSRDLAAFLLIAYYAGCGLASIIAGRRYSVGRLRLAGLGLAIYAAGKAIMQASDIGGLSLRVGALGAVGVFLLGAGFVYREARRVS